MRLQLPGQSWARSPQAVGTLRGAQRRAGRNPDHEEMARLWGTHLCFLPHLPSSPPICAREGIYFQEGRLKDQKAIYFYFINTEKRRVSNS